MNEIKPEIYIYQIKNEIRDWNDKKSIWFKIGWWNFMLDMGS